MTLVTLQYLLEFPLFLKNLSLSKLSITKLITIEDYCYIHIEWLDASNDEIVKKIIENKIKREDYITFRSNKK